MPLSQIADESGVEQQSGERTEGAASDDPAVEVRTDTVKEPLQRDKDAADISEENGSNRYQKECPVNPNGNG